MCKYCAGYGYNQIISITEGHEFVQLYLNRGTKESDIKHRNYLSLDLMVDIAGLPYPLESKTINIKYCPFCGREL